MQVKCCLVLLFLAFAGTLADLSTVCQSLSSLLMHVVADVERMWYFLLTELACLPACLGKCTMLH